MKLENWIRNNLQEQEERGDYGIATDAVRAWIDVWKENNEMLADSAFEKLIFNSYGQDNNFDRLRHNIAQNRCYRLPFFRNLT